MTELTLGYKSPISLVLCNTTSYQDADLLFRTIKQSKDTDVPLHVANTSLGIRVKTVHIYPQLEVKESESITHYTVTLGGEIV